MVLCTVRPCLKMLLYLGAVSPFISLVTLYRETMSQNVIVFRGCVPPLSPVVLCTDKLDLKGLCYYPPPLISRGTLYRETVSQYVLFIKGYIG